MFMPKKEYAVKRYEAEKKNERVEDELHKEETEPEEIITDELEYSDKHPHKEPEDPELNRRSTRLVIYTILAAVLIVGSIFVVSNFIETEEQSYTYNGFTFERYPGNEAWYTSVLVNEQIYPLPFHYGPKELEDIPYSVDEEKILSSEFIFLSLPPMEERDTGDARRLGQAAIEVGKVIGTRNNIFNIPARAAISADPDIDEPLETEQGDEIPIINCESLPENSTAIMFQIGDMTSVYEESDNCYIVQGTDGRDTIRTADRLVYGLLGIM